MCRRMTACFPCGYCILLLHVHSCLWFVVGEVEVGLKYTVGFNVVDVVLFFLFAIASLSLLHDSFGFEVG